MLLELQMYDLKLQCKPGKEMYMADALSRLKLRDNGTKIYDNK